MYHSEPIFYLSAADIVRFQETTAQIGKFVLLGFAASAVLALLFVASADTYARLISAVIDDPTQRSILPVFWFVLGAL